MKKTLQIILGISLVLFFGFFLLNDYGRVDSVEENLTTVIHGPKFVEILSYIEMNILEKQKDNQKIGLSKIVGGIVPHDIPTTIPLLADFYKKLKESKEVSTFIILAPDHNDTGSGISISKAKFRTIFGDLGTDVKVFEKIMDSGLVRNDERPFESDHSIHSQLPFIKKFFPESRIVTIVFNSTVPKAKAEEFGRILSSNIYESENMFVVSSIDFSHYLPASQAELIDRISLETLLSAENPPKGLIKADSLPAAYSFHNFVFSTGSNSTDSIKLTNTKDFNGFADYTTGHLSGFWGIK